MAINSTDFTAEQLYRQQQLLNLERSKYVLQGVPQRPAVPMGTPPEYQGKGVPTMAPSTGKSLTDLTLSEARNRALLLGAGALGSTLAIPAYASFAAGGAFGRPVIGSFAEKAIGGLPEYVEAMKIGGAGSKISMEVAKNAKRLSESNAMENLKKLMTDNPALKGLEELALEKGAKLAPLIDDYKWLVNQGKNVLLKGNETEKWAAEIIKKRFQ